MFLIAAVQVDALSSALQHTACSILGCICSLHLLSGEIRKRWLTNQQSSACKCRDTAGQERYASLAPLYYRGSSAAAVVYDITNQDTFAKAKHWISELQKNAGGDIGVSRLAAIGTWSC